VITSGKYLLKHPRLAKVSPVDGKISAVLDARTTVPRASIFIKLARFATFARLRFRLFADR
jgi:hypothetical protein